MGSISTTTQIVDPSRPAEGILAQETRSHCGREGRPRRARQDVDHGADFRAESRGRNPNSCESYVVTWKGDADPGRIDVVSGHHKKRIQSLGFEDASGSEDECMRP